MACYHPLYAWRNIHSINIDTGKPKLRFWKGKAPSEEEFYSYNPKSEGYEYLMLPCNKCIGCRLKYSKEWAERCMLEAKSYDNNQFITLTYEDSELNMTKAVNTETGEVLVMPTLEKKDLTKFMKDLRRYYEYHYDHKGIRFYAAGEYGTLGGRPHFHLIVFNLPIYDKVEFFRNKNHDMIYLSETISKIWGKGIVSIGDVTQESAAYVARYVVKKQKGLTRGLVEIGKELYDGLVPEFTNMSRDGGIGLDYYLNNKDKIYQNDEIIITNKNGIGEVIKPCKYYDRLFDMDSPEAMKAIKERRKQIAENRSKLELSRTTLSKEEYLQVKENNKLKQIELLKRPI